jgi:hypothetical protein
MRGCLSIVVLVILALSGAVGWLAGLIPVETDLRLHVVVLGLVVVLGFLEGSGCECCSKEKVAE